MKKRNYILALIATVLLSIGATSCDKYLDVNVNKDAPDYVDAYLYLAGIEQNYFGLYWDIRALGPLTQMMGTTSYTNFANHYYTSASDAGGEIWRMVYWNQGMNLENMINQSIDAENWTLVGIGYAMKAFSWDAMTKYHADLPMKQAFVPGLLSHEYDYQDEIYAQVREWALEAIKYLEMQDDTNYGTKISANDYIYGGDKEKWKRFAYATLVRNLASLTHKADFKAKYYEDLKKYAAQAFKSNADNAALKIAGGGATAAQSAYNNFWGAYRGNLTNVYYPHEYAVQIMTGRIPKYTEDGNWIPVADEEGAYLRYEIADEQIICDTLEITGHFDPRPLAKLATTSGMGKETVKDREALKKYVFFGGTFTNRQSSFLNNSKIDPTGKDDANVPSFYNTPSSQSVTTTVADAGRWLYRDDAPYVMTTYAEIMFDLAEAHFVAGEKQLALDAFKEGVKADLEFTASYLIPGKLQENGWHTGDIVDAADFNALAAEYYAGPYVQGMTPDKLTLSHIMMQKFVALYPWGAGEVWVDQRKCLYDIEYTGDVPSKGNGWDLTSVNQKKDTDPTKIYKGFYLAPALVQGRKSAYNTKNDGSPCFRVRPRYNSEYMWNVPNLDKLKPIKGTADNYQCSMPWFAYPGDMVK